MGVLGASGASREAHGSYLPASRALVIKNLHMTCGVQSMQPAQNFKQAVAKYLNLHEERQFEPGMRPLVILHAVAWSGGL